MSWDWEYTRSIFDHLLRGAQVTCVATAYASLIAITLGLVLALLARAPTSVLRLPSRAIISLIRNTPLLVQLYFAFYVLPNYGLLLPAFATGVWVTGIHFAAYTEAVYRAGIASLPTGQWDAITALNVPSRNAWLRVILPQVFSRVVPALGNYVIMLFKATPLLAFITVPELLANARAVAIESFRYFEPMTLVGVFYLAVSYPTARFIRSRESDVAA